MKIVTVNLPISYINAIDALTGNKGLYPSRSELIRVAVREFLIRELEAAKSFKKYQESRIKSENNMNSANQQTVNGEEYITVGDKLYRIIKK